MAKRKSLKPLILNAGDELKLTRPWKFMIYPAFLNMIFIRNAKIDENEPSFLTLPTGTVLLVESIHVDDAVAYHRGSNSIAFKVESCSIEKFKGHFWATIDDVHELMFLYHKRAAHMHTGGKISWWRKEMINNTQQ